MPFQTLALLAVLGQTPAPPPGGAEPAPAGSRDLRAALREVINRGADLYNAGDPAGCYRLFQGALMVTKLQLAGRPELQQAVDAGLVDADRQRSPAGRAQALRRVLDKIRDAFKPADANPAQTPNAPERTSKPPVP